MSEGSQEPRRFGLPRARKAALDRLAQAYADDDIELSEYERRTAAAQSSDSLDELQRIMHDVPDFDLTELVPKTRVGEPAARAEPYKEELQPYGGELETTVQLLGDREYGVADLRGGLRVVSVLGDSTVDLRELRAGERVVLSHVSLLGDLTILLPRDCRIRRQHLLLLGDENRREPRRRERKKLRLDRRDREHFTDRAQPPANPPILELRGFKLLGDVTFIEL